MEKKKFSIGTFLLDIGLVFIVIAVIIIIIFVFPDNYVEIFAQSFSLTLEELITIIPIFLVATFLAGLVDIWVDKGIVIRLFRKTGLWGGLIFITVLGVITPGPIFAMFPIVLVLKRKGVEAHFIVAFIAGQTMMGPMRIPLEIYYLGISFLIVRAILAILMGIVSGLITYPFSKWLDKDIEKHGIIAEKKPDSSEEEALNSQTVPKSNNIE
ncbi:MAG TPA: permease [Candidatus Deferrimicrobium sp.]|nr:permease [Candidatus Deferrimicrobium sp.]